MKLSLVCSLCVEDHFTGASLVLHNQFVIHTQKQQRYNIKTSYTFDHLQCLHSPSQFFKSIMTSNKLKRSKELNEICHLKILCKLRKA